MLQITEKDKIYRISVFQSIYLSDSDKVCGVLHGDPDRVTIGRALKVEARGA
jgi:hypothetical protein